MAGQLELHATHKNFIYRLLLGSVVSKEEKPVSDSAKINKYKFKNEIF